MTIATQAKTTTAAPPEPAPQREWQVGDRLRGQHPKTHEVVTGILQKQGYKYTILYSPGGTTPILAETAELLTPVEDVVEQPCPFTEGDLLDYRGQRWEAGRVQKTPLLTWRAVLIEPDPGAGWSPDYLEWPCEEPCPAVVVASAIAPPAFDSEPFESVEHYLGSAILWQENEEFICPDGDPIAYRGWQVVTDSGAGCLVSFSVQTPEGEWFSGLVLNTDGPLSGLDHQQAIAYAKATIDNAIALAEKLSGQMSLLDAEPIAAEIVTTDPSQRLTELEADITEGLGLIEQGKAKIWAAVAAVRSEELWRVGGHPSFEAYCADRWNWKKANGHENALAGEVLDELLLSGVPVEAVPTSTSAMSQLAKADPGDRAEVLQKAAALNGGKVTEAAVREALKPELAAGDYVSPKWETQKDEIGVVERVIKTRVAHAMHNLEIKWLTHRGSSFAHSDGMIRRSPDDPLVIKAVKRREAEDEDLGDRLPAEDLTCDEAAALGLRVYRPDTSPEAIAEGLAHGYIVHTAEQPTTPADSAQAAAPEAEDDQPSAKHLALVPGDSGGGSAYAIGQTVQIEGEPLAAWVVATHLNEGGLMLWGSSGKRVVESRDVRPLGRDSHPDNLNYPAKAWLAEMVRVLGPEQVRSLLKEVA